MVSRRNNSMGDRHVITTLKEAKEEVPVMAGQALTG